MAARQVAKAQNAYIAKRLKCWPDLETLLGVKIDPTYHAQPFNYTAFKVWADTWKSTASARAEVENIRAENITSKKPKLQVSAATTTYNNITLFPEQQAVTDKMKDIFWGSRTSKFLVQDGETGSGKTYVAAALAHHVITNKLWEQSPIPYPLPARVLILTPKTVIVQYKRVLEEFGLGSHLGHLIIVTSYSQMTSTYGQTLFYSETFDPYSDTPDEPIIKLNPAFTPYFCVLDEFHRLNSPSTKQTKFALALATSANSPYILAMSATPWVTVNHSRLAVVASKRKYFGMTVDSRNFELFARNICREPAKPNIEAAKRLRAQLDDIIVSFPKVKWKAKAINQVLIVDFACPQHKQAADNAYEVFLERKRRAGENTKFGRFEEFIAMGQYRKAVEPFRVPSMVERGLADIDNGNSVVIGACFRKTIADAAYLLHQKGISRDQMSIIWGGKRDWNPKFLLSPEEFEEKMRMIQQGEELTPLEIRQCRETLDYKTEAILANETPEEQETRLTIQRSLGLTGMQSAEQRQVEIDKFQSGQSLVCLFTLAAGGVGLSLDQCRPDLRPRVSYLTPSYSGPEFKQALGRTIRRATVSDVFQYMCYMKGTVEEYHVAPLVDRKLKCIATITGSAFNIVDLDTATKVEHVYRSKDEAIKDADEIESQFQNNTEDKLDTEEDEL